MPATPDIRLVARADALSVGDRINVLGVTAALTHVFVLDTGPCVSLTVAQTDGTLLHVIGLPVGHMVPVVEFARPTYADVVQRCQDGTTVPATDAEFEGL